MIQQLKTDRIAQLMLAAVCLLALCICGVWAYFIVGLVTNQTTAAAAPTAQVEQAPPTATNIPQPANTPAPTPTRVGIRVDRQELVNYFDQRDFEWREETERGAEKLIGESSTGIGKIVLWSSPDDPEDLIELFYAFSYPINNGEASRDIGLEEMFQTKRIVMPYWFEGESWIPQAIQKQGNETNVNGLDVSIDLGPEESTGQFIVIFSIVE